MEIKNKETLIEKPSYDADANWNNDLGINPIRKKIHLKKGVIFIAKQMIRMAVSKFIILPI